MGVLLGTHGGYIPARSPGSTAALEDSTHTHQPLGRTPGKGLDRTGLGRGQRGAALQNRRQVARASVGGAGRRVGAWAWPTSDV